MKNIYNRKRKKFVGDFQESDLNSPNKRTKYWIASQGALSKFKRKTRFLQKQNSYLKKKIKSYGELIIHLRNNE